MGAHVPAGPGTHLKHSGGRLLLLRFGNEFTKQYATGGIDMKTFRVVLLALIVAWAVKSPAQEKTPLRLLETIPIPDAPRFWDHCGVDLKSHRLFAASED